MSIHDFYEISIYNRYTPWFNQPKAKQNETSSGFPVPLRIPHKCFYTRTIGIHINPRHRKAMLLDVRQQMGLNLLALLTTAYASIHLSINFSSLCHIHLPETTAPLGSSPAIAHNLAHLAVPPKSWEPLSSLSISINNIVYIYTLFVFITQYYKHFMWGAVKIYYNCLVCFWRVIVFWGGPYRFTGFCCFRHHPSRS